MSFEEQIQQSNPDQRPEPCGGIDWAAYRIAARNGQLEDGKDRLGRQCAEPPPFNEGHVLSEQLSGLARKEQVLSAFVLDPGSETLNNYVHYTLQDLEQKLQAQRRDPSYKLSFVWFPDKSGTKAEVFLLAKSGQDAVAAGQSAQVTDLSGESVLSAAQPGAEDAAEPISDDDKRTFNIDPYLPESEARRIYDERRSRNNRIFDNVSPYTSDEELAAITASRQERMEQLDELIETAQSEEERIKYLFMRSAAQKGFPEDWSVERQNEESRVFGIQAENWRLGLDLNAGEAERQRVYDLIKLTWKDVQKQ